MQLGRYSVSTLRPAPILSVRFSQDDRFFAVASETGYEVWRSYPLGLLRRRSLPGTLVLALPLPNSPLLVLQGGGNTPLYPPNKAVIYHDALGAAVAELEFGERIRGVAARQAVICIALVRRTIAFEYGVGDGNGGGGGMGKGKDKASQDGDGFWLKKIGEWETASNELGLVALATAPGSTLLALPGRQPGHVQLINLPPCRAPLNARPSSSHTPQPFRSPIILAHTHPLSTLSCTANGSHIVTTSERGTLLRVWDTSRGRLERELRRGVDRAEMWGVIPEDAVLRERPVPDAGDRRRDEARRKGGRIVGWSDKGTVHVWGGGDESDVLRPGSSAPNAPSLTHLLSRNLPLPKYFSSTASSAQYHLPRKNPHAFASVISGTTDEADELSERFVVGWIEVQVDEPPTANAVERRSSDMRRVPGVNVSFGVGAGVGAMGSREERHSFGSDETSSRTATPTALGRDTPTGRRPSTLSAVAAHSRSGSTSARKDRLKVKTPTQTPTQTASELAGTATATATAGAKSQHRATRIERQLVAITYSGDWYRLRIPESRSDDSADNDDDARDEVHGRQKGKCELVEYRRLGVGGGGW